MPLPLLQTRISIDQVRCLEEGDGMGSAEPYVWLVFFKVDGERVSIGADAFAHGECQIVATDGSHGNLGSDDVDAGDILNVPHRIGEFRTSMRPIAFSEAPEREPLGGQIGAVLVLLEEDQVSDNGAKAGYAALTDFAKKAIDAKVNELHLGKQEVNEDEINALIDAAIEAVEAEIRSVQDGSQNFWSWVDGDDRIGVKVLRFNHKDLTNNYWDISERFRFLNNTGVEEEWLVLGEGQGVEPSPRGFAHQRRSQDLGTPSAAGSPSVTFHPSSGVQNTVYRDAEGRLHELWRDGIGQIGTTNLTANASAPSARGNPFGYLETPTDQQIVIFRGDGGGVHALYWTTGAVGLDNLSFVAGSPAAAGSPVATYNPATNTHHVVYRSDDGRLHVMYWSGASDPVHYDGRALTDLVESPRAAGDPSAYFTPAGDNFVVYRATDSGIHSYYWSTGDVGHDPLSAVAGTPPAVGDPVAYYIPGSDLHQVTYRTGDGHLYELFSRGVERVSRPGPHGGLRRSGGGERSGRVLPRRRQHEARRVRRPVRPPLRDLMGARPYPDLRRPHAVGARSPGRRPSRRLRDRGCPRRHPLRRLPGHGRPDPRDLLDRLQGPTGRYRQRSPRQYRLRERPRDRERVPHDLVSRSPRDRRRR